MGIHDVPGPKILILTVAHGASHQRLAHSLWKALVEIGPTLTVKIVNTLEHCTGWFRAYYDSYRIPLKYWPALWGWIEDKQHRHTSTGPGWLYRRGGQGLFRFLQEFDPDIVIATEVGTCELAAMAKRERHARFYLVGAPTGVDIDRAWAQPEVDLYITMAGDVASQLEVAEVPPAKIVPCGVPIDPAFSSLPDRQQARARLGLRAGSTLDSGSLRRSWVWQATEHSEGTEEGHAAPASGLHHGEEPPPGRGSQTSVRGGFTVSRARLGE